jgi:NAD(P)-dependent dehydrogenase (short-subunit alcohol dehydrogenase family)
VIGGSERGPALRFGAEETALERPMHRFDSRRFIVTGAADGLGKAVAGRLAEEGARVAVADIAEEKLRAVAANFGEQVAPFTCDVSNEPEVRHTFASATDWMGGLDGLVNCAGIVDFGISHDYPLERWQRVIDVVLTGTFITNKAALPYLLESAGAVVNVGSIGGLRGKAWQAAYSAAKAGVANLTRALACEYVGRVRFNCVAVGGIGGNITENSGASIPPDGVTLDEFLHEYGRRVIPPVRLGEAHEVAGVVAFLLSDDASFMDGSVVVADGATLA